MKINLSFIKIKLVLAAGHFNIFYQNKGYQTKIMEVCLR